MRLRRAGPAARRGGGGTGTARRAPIAALTAAGLALLSACSGAPPSPSGPVAPAPRPEAAGYGSAVGRQPIPWTRETLARDFIELTFDTEWGARAARLLRWEGPVRIALAGPTLAPYRDDAAALAGTLDAATGPGLSVRMAADEEGEITLRTAPRREMAETAPAALCFFAPFRGDWPAYRRARRAGGARWSDVERFEAMTVFIPEDATPHEIRTCIQEETTQALGVGNDLSRLEDSMFNDDGAHLRPTAFDLLMLRLLYDPALGPRMERDAARAAALVALSRPDMPRFGGARRFPAPSDRVYDDLHARVFAARSAAERRDLSRRLIEAVETGGPYDHRAAEAYAVAALVAHEDGDHAAALRDMERAETALRRRLAPDDVRIAAARVTLAALLKREGRARAALARLDAALPVLVANARDRQIAQAHRWRAAALAQTGEEAEARAAARQALAWGAYVYGAEAETVSEWRAAFAEIGL